MEEEDGRPIAVDEGARCGGWLSLAQSLGVVWSNKQPSHGRDGCNH